MDQPLWLVRPKNTARLDEAIVVQASAAGDAFTGDRDEETIVAMAKVRPAIVISPAAELRRGDSYRVAPLYSYNPGSFWDRRRAQVQAGHIPYALHLNAGARLHAGVIRLDQVAVVPGGMVTETGGRAIAALDAGGLAILLEHYGRYLSVFDQSEVTQRP